MKLSLVVPASLFASACAGAAPPPASVVPVSQLPEPTPVTTTSSCVASERTEAPPINVTVQAPPAKAIDPRLAEALKRLPPLEHTVHVNLPGTLRFMDGKLRLHGKSGIGQAEVTLPTLTTQCEQTIQTAIQTQRPIEIKGKGRLVSDQVPGHGYISAFDLEDVSSCISR